MLCFALVGLTAAAAEPLGNAFTYQGHLTDSGAPAEGTFDLQFTLFGAASGGASLLKPLTNVVVAANGLFTTTLDFGVPMFTGDARWLQIAVRTNGSVGGFTTLVPRQPLTPAPYAFYAPDAGIASEAKSVSPGSVTSAGLTAGSVGSLQVADGSLTPADLGPALASNTFWRLGGNAGTTTPLNFLGTLDARSLELGVANQPVFSIDYWMDDASQLRPSFNAGFGNTLSARGSTIAGGFDNAIGYYASGSSIAGGSENTIGLRAYHSAVGGGAGNDIATDAFLSVVAGGQDNDIASAKSVISGGAGNSISVNSLHATIAGGHGNSIAVSSDYSAISGGESNLIMGVVEGGTIAGGGLNRIASNAGHYPVISGGWSNRIAGGASYAAIGGGLNNAIEINSWHSVISGGESNTVARDVSDATIAGGHNNQIDEHASNGAIGGGNNNSVGSSSASSTIAGGYTNTIGIAAPASTVAGGQNNHIGSYSPYATIAGGRNHSIGTNCLYAAIGGGYDHDIDANSAYTSIPGGYNNGIGIESDSGTVAGGENNSIGNSSRYATIAGGRRNSVGTNSPSSAIGGGSDNEATGNSAYATIAGGLRNNVGINVAGGTVGGGSDNTVTAGAAYATIPGGRNAVAANYGQMVYASGQFAAPGDAQASTYVLRRTALSSYSEPDVELFIDGVSKRITVGPERAMTIDGLLVGFGANHLVSSYKLSGYLKRVGDTTTFWGGASSIYEEMTGRSADVSADDANDALIILVRNGKLPSGAFEGEVRWVATVRTVEAAW
ncbi:MAG TPA: hypothetical protein VJA21_23825 [Verrucomicrobiae bacterium]